MIDPVTILTTLAYIIVKNAGPDKPADPPAKLAAAGVDLLAQAGIAGEVSAIEPSLEDVFVSATQRDRARAA